MSIGKSYGDHSGEFKRLDKALQKYEKSENKNQYIDSQGELVGKVISYKKGESPRITETDKANIGKQIAGPVERFKGTMLKIASTTHSLFGKKFSPTIKKSIEAAKTNRTVRLTLLGEKALDHERLNEIKNQMPKTLFANKPVSETILNETMNRVAASIFSLENKTESPFSKQQILDLATLLTMDKTEGFKKLDPYMKLKQKETTKKESFSNAIMKILEGTQNLSPEYREFEKGKSQVEEGLNDLINVDTDLSILRQFIDLS